MSSRKERRAKQAQWVQEYNLLSPQQKKNVETVLQSIAEQDSTGTLKRPDFVDYCRIPDSDPDKLLNFIYSMGESNLKLGSTEELEYQKATNPDFKMVDIGQIEEDGTFNPNNTPLEDKSPLELMNSMIEEGMNKHGLSYGQAVAELADVIGNLPHVMNELSKNPEGKKVVDQIRAIKKELKNPTLDMEDNSELMGKKLIEAAMRMGMTEDEAKVYLKTDQLKRLNTQLKSPLSDDTKINIGKVINAIKTI